VVLSHNGRSRTVTSEGAFPSERTSPRLYTIRE
jgi:hypothetical protein